MDLQQWLIVAAAAAGGYLVRHLARPSNQERAQLLQTIAESAAALAVSMNRNASWDQLLQNVINQVATASGTPTRNQAAIQRAAAAALYKLGMRPGA